MVCSTNKGVVRLCRPRTHLAWQRHADKLARAVTDCKNLRMRQGLAPKPSMKEQLRLGIQTNSLQASRRVSPVARPVCEGWSLESPAKPASVLQVQRNAVGGQALWRVPRWPHLCHDFLRLVLCPWNFDRKNKKEIIPPVELPNTWQLWNLNIKCFQVFKFFWFLK